MRTSRGNSSGRGESPRHVRGPRDFEGALAAAASDMKKCIKEARTVLRSLLLLVSLTGSQTLPEDLQTDIFDVCHHHLQKPVERRRCEDDLSLKWIIGSLTCLKNLGSSYFNRDATYKRRYTTCWPSIMKWLRAIVDGRYFHGEEPIYFGLAADAFNTAFLVCEEVFDEDEPVELAVHIWNGYKSPNGMDHFSAQPLLSCLSRRVSESSTGRLKIRFRLLLDASHNGPKNLIDKFIKRLQHATFHSTPKDVRTVLILTTMMSLLVGLLHEPISSVLFSPRTGRILVSVAKDIVNDMGASPSHQHIVAARSTLNVICGRVQPSYSNTILKAGILIPLLTLASFHSYDSDFDSLRFCDILLDLRRCLFFDDTVVTCRDELCRLYTEDPQAKDLLKKTSKEFRETWTAFEVLALEQAVLLRLFEINYAPERGACASYICRRRALRKQFKKCAGCGFALYCSTSCQRVDWTHHRNGCKNIDEESLDDIVDEYNRFPRKIAAIQVGRHWDHIVSLAKDKGIPIDDMAVRIVYTKSPFQISVFDYHELLDDTKHPPHHVMAANEILRRPEWDRRDCLMVILKTLEMEVTSIVYLNNEWMKVIPDVPDDLEDEVSTYIDEDGNAFACTNVDALRAGVRLAKKYAFDLDQPVWSKDVLHKATDVVIADFDQDPEAIKQSLGSGEDL